jgi:hypothetical protein
VVLTSNASCIASSTATSNNITTTVIQNAPASVIISSSDADNSICAGNSVTFTATPTNGGASPSYQWRLNGANVGSNSATYTTSALTNGQTVTVIMTSNAGCVTGSPATSNAISTTVIANVIPSVSIVSDATNNSVCEGTMVTFTATPVNGGDAPSYQWQINGFDVGTNSNVYSDNAFATGDVVTVIMTSNATPCVAPSTATSNGITMTVGLLPVLVAGSPASSTICEGESQTLTASGFASSGVLDTLDFQNFTSSQYVSSGSNSGGGNAFVTTSSPYIGNSGLIQITNNVDASNFTIAIASNFAGGSSSTTSQLTSPILDNSAYIDLSLIFNHSLTRSTGNTATVQVSTDGGTTWTSVKSYTTNQGNNSTFVRDSISLNAYLASTNFRIRFNTSLSVTGGGGARWWAIDNVLLKGLAPVQPLYVWTANTASGVNGLPSGSDVYSEANTSISVSPTTTTEYIVTAQDRVTGCTTQATPITVTVNPSPAAATVEGG